MKIRYAKLRDSINVITLFYGKTSKHSLFDNKIDEKKAEELKKIYNNYLDKRKEILNSTSFKVQDVFGDVISKDNFSQEKLTKLKNFSAKMM